MKFSFVLLSILLFERSVCGDKILDTEDDFYDGGWEGQGFLYAETYNEFGEETECYDQPPSSRGRSGLLNIDPENDEMSTGFWTNCPGGIFYLSYNFSLISNVTLYPTSVLIKGFVNITEDPNKEPYVLYNLYLGNLTLEHYFQYGESWFEAKYSIPHPEDSDELFLSVSTNAGFFAIDKIVLYTPKVEESIPNCENAEYYCQDTDQYGNEWIGCVGEILQKKCSPSSSTHATWFCSYNGEFTTETPDYSQCSNDWLVRIKNGVDKNNTVSETKALEWIETIDNMTQMAFETGRPLYYGHEIKKICNVTEELFKKLTDNISLSVVHQITSVTAKIFHRILINDNPWKEVNSSMYSAYRSVTGTAFLRAIQTSALKLIHHVDGENFYQLSQFEEFRVAAARIDRNPNESLIYPISRNLTEAYIEIPSSWTDHFPGVQTVGFVGIHISNQYANRLLPQLVNSQNENFQVLGEKLTFTFEGNQEITFLGEGAKIYFKHQNPLELLNNANETKSRRFPIPQPSNSTQVIKKCVYWDFGKSEWSAQGCGLKEIESDGTNSVCECRHLSSFAVLFDTNNVVSDQKALEIISWTLSIISIVCLLLTAYAFSPPYVKTERSPKRSITQHLAVSLLVAHVGLLLSIDTNNISPSVGFCTGIGAITHYAFLCSFAWMGWEGYVLYKAIFVVFETNKEPRWIRYSIAYGVPALVVIVTGIIGISKKESPYHSPTETDCWLSEDYIWAFIGPATLILLVNLILLIFSVRKAYQLTHNPKIAVNRQKQQSFGKMVTGSMSLSVILGLTWIFGYLVLINDRSIALAAAYIFTFLNASQGIFIFVFHVLTNPAMKKQFDRQLEKLNTNMGASSSKGFASQNSTKHTQS